MTNMRQKLKLLSQLSDHIGRFFLVSKAPLLQQYRSGRHLVEFPIKFKLFTFLKNINWIYGSNITAIFGVF